MADTQSTDAGVYAASYSSVKEAHDRIRDAGKPPFVLMAVPLAEAILTFWCSDPHARHDKRHHGRAFRP
eukprot:926738-Rhodomonas_salina.1